MGGVCGHGCDAAGTWYLPSVPETRFLYAQALSRNCQPHEPYCTLISTREVQADGKVRTDRHTRPLRPTSLPC